MRADAGVGERMETQWWKLKLHDAAEPVIVDGMPRDGSAEDPDFVLYDIGGHEKLRLPKQRLARVERLSARQAEREVFAHGARTFSTALVEKHAPDAAGRRSREVSRELSEDLGFGVGTALRFGLRRPEHKFLVLWAMIAATTALGWWRLTNHQVRTLAAYELVAGVDGKPDYGAWHRKWDGLLREVSVRSAPALEGMENPFVTDLRVLNFLAATTPANVRHADRWRPVALARAAVFAPDPAAERRRN